MLSFLPSLPDRTRHWILTHCAERTYAVGSCLVERGQRSDALFILTSGQVDVRPRLDGSPIATLGPEDLAGEHAFLEGDAATDFLVARQPTQALVLEGARLREHLSHDPDLGAAVYRSIARVASSRWRRQASAHDRPAVTVHDDAVSRLEAQLRPTLDAFRRLVGEADAAALREGQVPLPLERAIRQTYLDMQHLTTRLLGDASEESEATREEVGARLQRELLPYLLLSENGDRWYAKPRGYAGDFLSIARMYDDVARGVGRVGALLDRCFLDMPAALAVKNRRALLAGEIRSTLDACPGRPARVTSLACGPAQELFDVYDTLDETSRLQATGVDIDLQALAFVADRRDRQGLRKVFALEDENLIHLATGRRSLDLPPQDLIYSVGLIDYLDDDLVVQLMNWAHGALRPGGRLILGNFHPRNPSKALQDHLLDWRLKHRDEGDLHRLYQASSFARPCTRVLYEAQRINLFAEAHRA